MMHSVWKGFISEPAMVDPFRVHSPKRRIHAFVNNAGKSRGDRVYVNEEGAPLSAKEPHQAVYDLNENKSPGLDGLDVRTRPRLARSKILP